MIANLFLKAANAVSGRSSDWANKFLDIARGMAEKDNAKLKIELPEGEGSIQYRFEKTNGDETTAWGHYFGNAGLFIEGHAQEINVDSDSLKDATMELTDKAKIEPLIRANVGEALWGFGSGSDKQEQLSYIIMGGLAIVIVMMLM